MPQNPLDDVDRHPIGDQPRGVRVPQIVEAEPAMRALYDLETAARAGDENAWPQLEPKTHLARDQLRAAMRSELGIAD